LSDLRKHTLSSIKWVVLANLLPKVITPVISVYLATILIPKDYGVVAISGTLIGFINLIQGFGIIDFIGKEKEIDKDKLNTSFWINLTLGFALFLFLYISSSFIASIYNESLLKEVIQISGIILIIDAFGIVQFAQLRREMQFKKLFWRSLVPVLASILVTLPLALAGYGVWALVAGQIARSILNTALFWFLSSWRPNFLFSKEIFRKIITFGAWNNFEKFQEYFANNSLSLLILGYYASISTLGVYSVAIHILGTIFLVLRAPLQNMTLPLLSKVQNSEEMLLITFKKIISRMMFINLPITAGIFLLSEIGVAIVFPDRWIHLGMVMSVIILGQGILLNFGAQRELLKVMNKPQIYPKTLTINLVISSIIYIITAKYGDLFWYCIAKTLNDLLFAIIQIYIIHKYLGVSFKELLNIAKIPLISTFIMSFFILSMINLMEVKNEIIPFLSIIFAGIITYSFSYYMFDRKEYRKITTEILEIIGLSNFIPGFIKAK